MSKPTPGGDAEIKSLRAALWLCQDMMRRQGNKIEATHKVFTRYHVASNGAEGYGKRQSLTLPQRARRACKGEFYK